MIDAICQWCVVSAALMALLLIVSAARAIAYLGAEAGEEPGRPSALRCRKAWLARFTARWPAARISDSVRARNASASEAEEQAQERRQRLIRLGAGAVFAAVVVVAVAIVISQSGDDSGGDTTLEGISSVQSELRGLEQQGLTLGDPDAKVTVVEFGDLQCPVCKDYSEQILPEVIEGPVRSGDAKLEFRNWTIIGPDSLDAAKAALAASEQGRYWSFITLFYRNQGAENSGYVSDSFLEAVAEGAGVEDISSSGTRTARARNGTRR